MEFIPILVGESVTDATVIYLSEMIIQRTASVTCHAERRVDQQMTVKDGSGPAC
jgi:hypothetical protein